MRSKLNIISLNSVLSTLPDPQGKLSSKLAVTFSLERRLMIRLISEPLVRGIFSHKHFLFGQYRIHFVLSTNKETVRNRTFLELVCFSLLSCFHLFRLCLGVSASKHNDEGVYDRRNRNHDKKIVTMLVIMPVSFKHLIVI